MSAKPLRLHPAAEAEAIEARQWYEERSESAAAAFIESLNAALQEIQRRPGSHPVYDDPLRVVVLRKFPYAVLYRERDDEVEITAVAHTSRMPGYWRNRLDD